MKVCVVFVAVFGNSVEWWVLYVVGSGAEVVEVYWKVVVEVGGVKTDSYLVF